MATDTIHLRSSLGCAAFLFAGGILASLPSAAAPLSVTITHIATGEGDILVTVCTREVFLTPNCFPRRKLPAAPGTLRVTFSDLAPGTYAVQVIHDAKRIGGLERDALGIPIGGYALSNEAVEIRMRYSDPD